MNILVTGGAGYLGSVLIPKLLARGHEVSVLDIGYFGLGHLRYLYPAVELIRADITRINRDGKFRDSLLDGCECIIHLAALSNDPSAELNPELTKTINFEATVELAKDAKARGIRFLFSSSCSIYGSSDGEVNEEGEVNPLTVYAISKLKAEEALIRLKDNSWSPIILRNGTLFGYSPRMRFDLVVNIFSLYSTLHNQIKVFGDGMQWRPFLHVSDCARAFAYFAEKENPQFSSYNVAYENLRVIDVVKIFKRINPKLQVEYVNLPDDDQRNYNVSTDRMHKEGFSARLGVDFGSEEMVESIISGLIPDPESIYYRNSKWLKELSQIGSNDQADMVKMIEMIPRQR